MGGELRLVHTLCETLRKENISYCHWKSNIALDRSATGQNDLDLLISRADLSRFTHILHLMGFKEARTPVVQQLPGILDYYGYDCEADKLIHVHAHYQLVLGHDRTKGYRLPIEGPFLASATESGLFNVPAPAFELIVFVVRMILKHATWDVVFFRHGALPVAALEELRYLQSRASTEDVYQTLKRHMPYMSPGLFDRCVETLELRASVWKRIGTGRRLQMQLKPFARRSQVVDVYLKLWRRTANATRRRMLRRFRKRRLAGGGALIAVIGGDGSGKSTATAQLYTWLSKNFDTIKVHMGKPPRSWTTKFVRGTLKVTRPLNRVRSKGPFFRAGTTGDKPMAPNYSQLLMCACSARDRYRAAAKARRLATNGGIVICDRFPIPEIRQMDSPCSERLGRGLPTDRLSRFLVRLEKGWYTSLGRPDVLIVLRVDPEIAVARKPNEESTAVRKRATEVWERDWHTTCAYVIDASQSAPAVNAELKSFVWSQL